jgi:uncharacterized membrane protein YhfC
MQNIDPLYFLTPIITIAFSCGLVFYWTLKRKFSAWVLLLSLTAYAGAIALKEGVQLLTLQSFSAAVGGNPAALGVYFGIQTVVFEVGGAFLVARYAFSKGRIGARDAEGYGIGLAFWENGVLVGGALLLNYVIYDATLAGGGPGAQQLYNTLASAAPALFYSPSGALPLVGFAVLERISSLLVHFSWGLLVVLSVAFRRKLLLMFALPMGLIDILPPYANQLDLAVFELLVFAVSVLCLVVALGSTVSVRRVAASPTLSQSVERSNSLIRTNFKRALGFGRIYLFIGIILPLLLNRSILGVNATTAPSANVLLAELYPLALPLFATMGAVGGLMVFVSDKSKGVYEYLIAYGVGTYEIFWSTVVVTLGLVTVVLIGSLAASSLLLLATGGTMEPVALELLLVYSVPLSYAAAAFMSMSGMVWSFLTTRVAGINSPVGLAPILGIGPVLAVFLAAEFVGPGNFTLLTAGAAVVLLAAVALMMVVAGKKMVRERLLSEA